MIKHRYGLVCAILLRIILGYSVFAQHNEVSEYSMVQHELKKGWNTWNNGSIAEYVLLPQCAAVRMTFKQQYWIEEAYLHNVFIGRTEEHAERVRPGYHALDGSWCEFEMWWEELHVKVEMAGGREDDLLVLVTPLSPTNDSVKVVVEGNMLWNRPGHFLKKQDYLQCCTAKDTLNIFIAGDVISDAYTGVRGKHFTLSLQNMVGISSGSRHSVEEIAFLLEERKAAYLQRAEHFGELAEAARAIEAGLAWNTIYEPKYERVVSTVGRLWNKEYGGYCLFGWDNFFLAYMTALFDKELAVANIIEHVKSATSEGFIPNDDRGNGSKSYDRSQPPVGGMMLMEVYKQYPERWFLAYAFDPLLKWNRWWMEKRMNEGLLSYGSHKAENPYHETSVGTRRTAGYESGMDDSPMYMGVPFNEDKNTLELQDVGLNSLYIADCNALAKVAGILGRKKEELELKARSRLMAVRMESLWSDSMCCYLNKRTDSAFLSSRLSPTIFYPLLAEITSAKRSENILQHHFYNEEEFFGEWMLPSIARNDSEFYKQRYWKGAIWPPLNFLTYLGLRKSGQYDAGHVLAEKSMRLFIDEWRRQGFVSENYSSITGTGDDKRLSSDRFHSWGALFGFMMFIDEGYLLPTENDTVRYDEKK